MPVFLRLAMSLQLAIFIPRRIMSKKITILPTRIYFWPSGEYSYNTFQTNTKMQDMQLFRLKSFSKENKSNNSFELSMEKYPYLYYLRVKAIWTMSSVSLKSQPWPCISDAISVFFINFTSKLYNLAFRVCLIMATKLYFILLQFILYFEYSLYIWVKQTFLILCTCCS